MRSSMLHREISVLGLVLAGLILGASTPLSLLPVAAADRAPEKPSAPTNIDETPPLVPIPNARVTKTGLLIGGQPTPEQLTAIREAGYRTILTLRTDAERGDEG